MDTQYWVHHSLTLREVWWETTGRSETRKCQGFSFSVFVHFPCPLCASGCPPQQVGSSLRIGLSPVSRQELPDDSNHVPLPSNTLPSASRTERHSVKLHWVVLPIQKCVPGAETLLALVLVGSKIRKENCASVAHGQASSSY